jgi:hypothetical protein
MASLILPCSSRMLARRKRVNEGPRSGCAAMRRFIDSAAGTGVAEPAAAIPIYRRRGPPVRASGGIRSSVVTRT